MPTRMISTRHIADLIGCPIETVRGWKRRGWIAPTVPAANRACDNLFDPSAALAVILMGVARSRGVDPKTANTVYRTFLNRSLDDIKADIDAGRGWLICVGGSATPLVSLGDVAGNRAAFGLAERLGVGYVVIDVATAISKLENALAQLDSSPVGDHETESAA